MALLAVLNLADLARAVDLTWTADETVTIGSASYTIKLGSTADQITVGGTTLVVTVPADSAGFEFESSNRYALNNDRSLPTQCDSGRTYLIITGPSVVTITPDTSSTPCDVAGGGSGGSGGSPRATPVAPVTLVAPAAPAAPVSTAKVYNLGTAVLKDGSRGEAVKELQRFLNDKLNLGLELDGILGPKTIAVIKTWQATNGLVADGLIGPKTKALINTGVSTAPTAPVSTAKVYNLGTAVLKNGSRGEAAKELQRFLNDKLTLGLVVDGIIGPKTIAVMKTWQTQNGLVADGLIGPKTKAKINGQ